MATFGRKLGAHLIYAPQNTIAAEALEEGWVVKLDPAGEGEDILGCDADADNVYGIVWQDTGDEDGNIASGDEFTLCAIGEAYAQVVDGETLVPGDSWRPSTTKGKIDKCIVGERAAGTVRGNASGTGQTVLVTVGFADTPPV